MFTMTEKNYLNLKPLKQTNWHTNQLENRKKLTYLRTIV